MDELESVFNDDWPQDHRSGFVAVVGRTNVGKSTLINAILGQKIAIVTPKPQTTQRRQLGIYTETGGQIIFVDTPGLHNPQHKLGEYMIRVAENALRDADVILWVLDASAPPNAIDRSIAETIQALRHKPPLVLALNKIDLLGGDKETHPHIIEHRQMIDYEKSFLVSALQAEGVHNLTQSLLRSGQ
jgi:GTP-binding protein Era